MSDSPGALPFAAPCTAAGLTERGSGASRALQSLTSCSFRAERVTSRRCSLLWADRGCCSPPAAGRCGMARAARTSSCCFSRSTWSSWRPARAACSLSPTRLRSQPPGRGAPSSIVSAGPRHRPWQGGGGEDAGLLPPRAVPALRAPRRPPPLAPERVERSPSDSCGFGGEVGTGEGEREGGSEGKRLRIQAAPGPPPGWIRGARSQYPALPPPRAGAAPAYPIPVRASARGAALASSSAPAAKRVGVPALSRQRQGPANRHRAPG